MMLIKTLRILLMMLTKVFLVRVALGAQKTYE